MSRPHLQPIPVGVEQALIERFQRLPFKQFEFHGFLSNRRVVSFGWRYDFARATLRPSDDIPREAPLDQVRDLGPQYCLWYRAASQNLSIGVLRAYSSGSVVNSNG